MDADSPAHAEEGKTHHTPYIKATIVRVSRTPSIERGAGLTWIADEEPRETITKGDHIRLEAEGIHSGIGKISHVVEITQHWVTFTITGATRPCFLRIPVAWTELTGTEGAVHKNLYNELPKLPAPHRDAKTKHTEKGNAEITSNDQLDWRLHRIMNTRPVTL